jgi:AAA+ ATPase superfamily predicted ATPase
MLKADYIGQSPNMEVEKIKDIKNPVQVRIVIGEVEYTVEESDAKYLLEELEDKLLDYNWTRNGLESRIDDLEQEVEHLEAELKSIRGW